MLLANLLQRSRTVFSRVSFSSFLAFKEGMYNTQSTALLSSPTVSARMMDFAETAAMERLAQVIRYMQAETRQAASPLRNRGQDARERSAGFMGACGMCTRSVL